MSDSDIVYVVSSPQTHKALLTRQGETRNIQSGTALLLGVVTGLLACYCFVMVIPVVAVFGRLPLGRRVNKNDQ